MKVTLDRIKGTLEQYVRSGTVADTLDMQNIPIAIALLGRVLSDGIVTRKEQKQLKSRFSEDAIAEIASAPLGRSIYLARIIQDNKGPTTASLIHDLARFKDYLTYAHAHAALKNVVFAKATFGGYQYSVDARLAAMDALCPTFTTHQSMSDFNKLLGRTEGDPVSSKVLSCFIDYSTDGPCKCTDGLKPKKHKVTAM